MLTVMLCGAADTDIVLDQFRELGMRMGFDAWSYLDGTIRYHNSATSGWRENSRASVLQADVAVFVLIKRFGEIAWTEELSQALTAGLPFLMLCLDETFSAFRAAQRGDAASGDHNEDQLFTALDRVEREYQVTIVPFGTQYFADTLQQHLGGLLQRATTVLRGDNERAAQRLLISGERELTPDELEHVRAIAVDELEDKNIRKRALEVLANANAIDAPTALDLCRSLEQGVARKMLTLLPVTAQGFPLEFFAEVAEVVNELDDVGMDRRLITALFALDADRAYAGLAKLTISEIGSARRVLAGIAQREDLEVGAAPEIIRAQFDALVSRCLAYGQAGGRLPELAAEARRRLGTGISQTDLAVAGPTDANALTSAVAGLGGTVIGHQGESSITTIRFEGSSLERIIEMRDALRALGFHADTIAAVTAPKRPASGSA